MFFHIQLKLKLLKTSKLKRVWKLLENYLVFFFKVQNKKVICKKKCFSWSNFHAWEWENTEKFCILSRFPGGGRFSYSVLAHNSTELIFKYWKWTGNQSPNTLLYLTQLIILSEMWKYKYFFLSNTSSAVFNSNV